MKAVMSAARYLFIICLPFLLLTVVIAAAVNSSWLYTHGFQKFDVRQALADNGLYVTGQDMSNIAHGFIHYWNSGEKYISLTVQQQGKQSPFSTRTKSCTSGMLRAFSAWIIMSCWGLCSTA